MKLDFPVEASILSDVEVAIDQSVESVVHIKDVVPVHVGTVQVKANAEE